MMEIFSTPKTKDQICAEGKLAFISANVHRCQVSPPSRATPTMRSVRASIAAIVGKTGKPVCYNVSVGGNHAAALFDIVRI